MSKLSSITSSPSFQAVKRKSVSSRWTRCKLARPAFIHLKAFPLYRLPPNMVSAVSDTLAKRLTSRYDTQERWKRCRIVKQIGSSPRKKDRPTVNLSNTRLTKENLHQKYHFLVNPSLRFRHLAEVLRYRKSSKAASFAGTSSANIKLAHLAYRLSRSSTPKTLAKIGTQDVSHLCGNRTCFHPDHLVVETHKKNVDRNRCFEEERRGGKPPTSCSHKPACIFSTWRVHSFVLIAPPRSGRSRIAPTIVQPPLQQNPILSRPTDYKPPCRVAHCRPKNFYLDIPPL